MTEDKKAYPMVEVARHTTSSSCWMVIDKKVYDVTSFLLEHPGGDDILLDSAGRDATREFEDVGHSADARDQLADLVVGDLREPTEEELALAEKENQTKQPTNASAGGLVQTLVKWLFPLVLLGVAVVLRKYT